MEWIRMKMSDTTIDLIRRFAREEDMKIGNVVENMALSYFRNIPRWREEMDRLERMDSEKGGRE